MVETIDRINRLEPALRQRIISYLNVTEEEKTCEEKQPNSYVDTPKAISAITAR
jgi:hypothetical protein